MFLYDTDRTHGVFSSEATSNAVHVIINLYFLATYASVGSNPHGPHNFHLKLYFLVHVQVF